VEYDTVQYFRMECGTIHWGLQYGTEDFVTVLYDTDNALKSRTVIFHGYSTA